MKYINIHIYIYIHIYVQTPEILLFMGVQKIYGPEISRFFTVYATIFGRLTHVFF